MYHSSLLFFAYGPMYHFSLFVLFHHNAKPSKSGQLHFQTFQFSYRFINLHNPLFKSMYPSMFENTFCNITRTNTLQYYIRSQIQIWKKIVYDYVWYIWMIESIYDEHNIETRRKGILKSKGQIQNRPTF